MQFEFLFVFAFLYIAEKVRDNKRWPFYTAAFVYVVPLFVIGILTPLTAQLLVMGSISTNGSLALSLSWHDISHWLLQYIGAAVTLFFLAKFEDTVANWLITFLVGFIMLTYVL
jgi:hypothetical protein